MKRLVILLLLILTVFCFFGCGKQESFRVERAVDVASEDFAIALRKGDDEMKQAVNQVINTWLNDGSLEKYHNYYDALARGENPEVPNGLKTEWDFGDSQEVLEMFTESGFEPYEFIYNGKIVGVDVAIASQVALNLGLRLEIKDVDFKTIISGLNASNNKAIAAAGLTVDEERKNSCDFSDVYATSVLSIVQKSHDQYKSIKSLDGCIIGVQEGSSGDFIISDAFSEKGYTYEEIDSNGNKQKSTVKISGQIVRLTTYSAAIEMLNLGKIDAIFMDERPAMLLVENSNLNANANIATKFYNAVVAENRWKLYLEGMGNTLIIALLAVILGVVIGFCLAAVIYVNKTFGKLKIASKLARLYVTAIRGTPVVLQLFIMYFIVLSSMDSDILIGAITFGLNSSAYVAEILRAGFESVDGGQTEAGRALGLPLSKTLGTIVFPQAIKNSLPPLFNEFISLVKETAVVGYVGIMDLGKVPGLIQSRTFDYLFPLIISAGLYLAVVCILTAILRLLEKKFAKSERNQGGVKNV